MNDPIAQNPIERLLRPRSVAVVGASADPSKTAGRPVAYLQRHGYAGAIYPVNPRADEVGGLRCYPDIAALPEAPDVALVLLGAGRATEAVAQLAERGTAAAIVLASGYAEVGGEGAQRQEELKRAAGAMRLLGPNTIGLVNLRDRIVLSASGALEMAELPAGNIALVSQSGGILGATLSRGAAAGIGFSALVSTSNEADLEVADFVAHFARDPHTAVIALYLETLRHPENFRQAVRQASSQGKPVVVYKVGRSEAGARAAASHTGALAGGDAMYEALFRQVGAIRAQRYADLLDIANALAARRRPAGRRVAILTSTGGAGTLVADSLGAAGFDAPPPGPDTAQALRALHDDAQMVLDRNPIDVTLAGLQPDLLARAVATLAASDDYDAVVTVVGSSALGRPRLAADAIAACLPHTGKPLLAYVSPHAPEVLAHLNRIAVPALAAPESIGTVLHALHQAGRAPVAAPQPIPGDVPAPPAQWRGSLDEVRARALFASCGIAGPREAVVHGPEDGARYARELGQPVVVKVVSPHITHKTEAGGVALDVPPERVAGEIQAMDRRVRERAGVAPEGFLIQERVQDGVEIILGLRRDAALGTSLLLGFGGVTAELFRDTSLRLLPVDRDTVLEMLQALRAWPLLDGYRGRPRADVPALVEAVLRFAQLAQALGDRLVEAEINPLFVLEAGQGVRAVDAVAVLA
ncbi:acetate--CoA ligase family protein [Bordetella sp. 2513F-2]